MVDVDGWWCVTGIRHWDVTSYITVVLSLGVSRRNCYAEWRKSALVGVTRRNRYAERRKSA